MKGMKLRIALGLITIFLIGLTGEARAAEKRYSLEVATGLGYDSNAFLAPNDSYFDPLLDQPVVPDRKSGFFIPVSIEGDYSYGKFFSSLDFEGKVYPRRELNDADTYISDLDLGLEFLLREKDRRKDSFRIGPSVGYHREIYVDRDTGQEKTTPLTQQNVGDRYTYYRYGLEAKLRMRTLPVKLDLKGAVAKYEYDEVPVLESLDYTLYRIGANAEFDLFTDTWLDVNADYYIKDFEDRRSRNHAGDLVDGTDRKYTYYGAGASLGRRLGPNWTAYLDYDYLKRVDKFAGYWNYDRNRLGTRVRYRDKDGRRLRFELAYWQRDYPRAFAFDQPISELNFIPRRVDYETWEAEVKGELPLSRLWKVWAEYAYINQSSADPRYDYRRHQISLGVSTEL